MTIAERFARFCRSLRFEDLPAETVHRAKMCVLDMVGVMVAAWKEESTQVLFDYFAGLGGREEATVFVSGKRLPAQNTALINGAMSHSLELEDHHSHRYSLNHPGVTTIPVALALAERERAVGTDFLTAVVLGYEIGSRIGKVTRTGVLNLERGFHESSVCGPFSSAATAGKLMDLDSPGFARAFGIAGCLAAGNTEFKANGAWTKRFQVGNASRNGIVAAELAARGLTAPVTIFEGEHGFYRSYVLDGNYTLDGITRGLGDVWEINNIIYKPFGCAGVLHSAVTAAQNLFRKHHPQLGEITRIEIRTSSKLLEEYAKPVEEKARPKSKVDAQFSLPYCVAVTLKRGQALVDEFEPGVFNDPEVVDLARRVVALADPEIDRAWPARDPTEISLVFRGGQVVTERVEAAKGDLSNPVTDEELLEKFRYMSGREFSHDTVRQVEDFLMNLETAPDVGRLAALLLP